MADFLAQRVNFAILFAPIGVICKSNIIVKGGEVKLKCHMFNLLCFNTCACPINLLFNMFAEH